MRGACKLAPRRKPKGSPCVLSKACGDCGEWRCKAHCKCARDGVITDGRKRSRAQVQPSAPTQVASSSASEPHLGRPSGRLAATGFEVLLIAAWWQMLVDAVSAASVSVWLATLVYDHDGLTAALVRRLRGQAAVSVTIMVDKESFEKREAPRQRPRLRELHEAGASVYLCRGIPPYGRLHGKVPLVDRRVAFGGSANLTNKSSSNWELPYRAVGPPLDIIRSELSKHVKMGVLWDGR